MPPTGTSSRAVPAVARLQFGLRTPSFSVPGCDLAGVVKAIGRDVATVRPGDEVFASSFMHGFGAFAVQIAKALGGEVTGVCSTPNVEMVRSLGADHVMDYTAVDFTDESRRYDLILQAAGVASARACRRVMTANGTLVQISGNSGNRWVGPLPRIVSGRLLSPFVSQTITSFTVEPNGQDLDFLRTLLEAGDVAPVIDRTYSLTEIHDAVRHVEGGHARGKVVVTVETSAATIDARGALLTP